MNRKCLWLRYYNATTVAFTSPFVYFLWGSLAPASRSTSALRNVSHRPNCCVRVWPRTRPRRGGRHGMGQGEAGAGRGRGQARGRGRGGGVKGASLRHVDPTITHEKGPLLRAPPLLRLAVWPAKLGRSVSSRRRKFSTCKKKKVTSDIPEK